MAVAQSGQLRPERQLLLVDRAQLGGERPLGVARALLGEAGPLARGRQLGAERLDFRGLLPGVAERVGQRAPGEALAVELLVERAAGDRLGAVAGLRL